TVRHEQRSQRPCCDQQLERVVNATRCRLHTRAADRRVAGLVWLRRLPRAAGLATAHCSRVRREPGSGLAAKSLLAEPPTRRRLPPPLDAARERHDAWRLA